MSDLRQQLEKHQESFLQELFDFLKIPSVSTAQEHNQDIKKAADFLIKKLEQLGFNTELIETPQHPAVYASLELDKELPTVLIYGHYDVQPADPLELWDTPPFEPTLKDGLIFARGASDDKGQVYAHIKGVDLLFKNKTNLGINLKFLIEGEEEIGSPNLAKVIKDRKDDFAADIVLISDSSMMAANTATITYGLKGLAYIEVEVTAASHDLHSGAYGGAVPNPINILAAMIAKLHNEDGSIAVTGFYENVLDISQEEKDAYKQAPFSEEDFKAETGIRESTGEPNYTTLERLWARPTLDANGIKGGYQDEGAKTVIAAKASAKLSSRIVPNQTPQEISRKLESYLKQIAPSSVTVTVKELHGGLPALTPINSPAVQLAAKALERVYNKKAIFARTGGTIPVVTDFQQILGADVVLVGFGLEDDRIHSPNEKFDLENYYQGILSSAYILRELANFK